MFKITKFVIAAALTTIIAAPIMAQASDGTPSVEEIKEAEDDLDEFEDEYDSNVFDEGDTGCPCWTEEKLEGLASGEIKICEAPSGKFDAHLLGTPGKSYMVEEAQVGKNDSDKQYCRYKKVGEPVIVKNLNPVEFVECVALINRECYRRKRL